MLDLKEIERAIAELEHSDTTMANCQKLCYLYAVQDRALKDEQEDQQAFNIAPYSQAMRPIMTFNAQLSGDSDFLNAIADKDIAEVWEIIDDLMDTLRAANPRVYNSIMRRIKELD